MGQRAGVIARQGFLAGHLVDELRRAGHEPVLIDPVALAAETSTLSRSHGRGLKAGPRAGDLTRALEGCRCVHYLGREIEERSGDTSHPRGSQGGGASPTAALLVLRAARDAGARRVVYAGTCRTRRNSDGRPVDEDALLRTTRSERDASIRRRALEEEAIADWALSAGLKPVSILHGGPIGPRDAGSGSLGAALVRRLNGELSAGVGVDGLFPVVDVRDVARAHVAAQEMTTPSPAYLVVAESVTGREWAGLFSRVTGLPTADRMIRPSLAGPVAFAMDAVGTIPGARAWLNRGAVHEIREHQHYDCRRAQRELGVRFTPLETSVRDAVTWYVRNGWITDEARLAIVQSALARSAYDAALPKTPRPVGVRASP